MNILIVEDEPKAAQLLSNCIKKESGLHHVVGICESINDTVTFWKSCPHKIDLLFMDIQLADGLSFEIFDKIDITVPVVFCTAYDSYMLQAFKKNGFDYILKPFEQCEIQFALNKYKTFFTNSTVHQSKDLALVQHSTLQEDFALLGFKRNNRVLLSPDGIALALLENKVLRAITFDGDKIRIDKTIEELNELLPEHKFYRINRQMMINRNCITKIIPLESRKVRLETKILNYDLPIIVSRLKVPAFLKWIEGEW